MSETSVVWLLTIDHRHGRDIHIHRTERGAYSSLVAYVDDWWSELPVDKEFARPANNKEAVELYFDTARGESYDMGRAIVYE